MKFSIEKNKSLNSKILWAKVDNPGAGDCGFYAFAIGLINIIKREIARTGRSERLDMLNAILGKEPPYTAQEFLNFDFNQKRPEDQAFLRRLEEDFREITFRHRINELKRKSISVEGSNELQNLTVYNQFKEVFALYNSYYRGRYASLYQDLNAKDSHNLFFRSERICQIAKDLSDKIDRKREFFGITDAQIEKMIDEAIMKDLYGEDYLEKTRVSWKDSLNQNENLSEKEKSVIALFKMFKSVTLSLVDYPNLDPFLTKDFDSDFEQIYREASKNVAEEIKDLNSDEREDYIQRKFLEVYKKDLENAFSKVQGLKNISEEEKQLYQNSINDSVTQAMISINSESAKFLEFAEKTRLRQEKSEELVIREESEFYQGLDMRTNGEWLATMDDMNSLAEVFDVKLITRHESKGQQLTEGSYDDLRPSVVICNTSGKGITDGHWTTMIPVGDLARSSSVSFANSSFKGVTLTKEEIRDVLSSYTNGMTGTFFRSHGVKARDLIDQCNDEGKTVSQIMEDFRTYMNQLECGPRSSFLKRLDYLDARYRNSIAEGLDKRDIERIFLSYVENNVSNRNHLREAQFILSDCRNPEKRVSDVLERIEEYVTDNQFNTNSSFMKRVNEVRALEHYYKDKYSDKSENLNFEEHGFGGLAMIGNVY